MSRFEAVETHAIAHRRIARGQPIEDWQITIFRGANDDGMRAVADDRRLRGGCEVLRFRLFEPVDDGFARVCSALMQWEADRPHRDHFDPGPYRLPCTLPRSVSAHLRNPLRASADPR